MLGIDDIKDFINELPQDLLDKRPENLTPEQFAELANRMYKHKQN